MSTHSVDPGSVISRALRIYGDNAVVLLTVAVVVYAIEAVLAYLVAGILGGLIGLIAGTFYQGMVVELVRDVQDDRRDSGVGDLFRAVAPVVLPLIAVSILAGIGIGIGFILLIVPGLFLLTIWSVVAPVTVLERPGVFAAFGRSRELVKGYGWNVFGVMVVVFLLAIVVAAITAIVASPLSDVGEAVVQWALSVLVAPFSALIAAVLYFALRSAHGEPIMGAGAATPEGAPQWQPPSAGTSAPPPGV